MPQHPITVVGNLTNDPHMVITKTGANVTTMRVAASRSVRDGSEGNGWRDIDHLFIDVEMWGQLAANVRQTLFKGTAVVVTGRLVTNQWVVNPKTEEKEQETRQRIVIKADRVGLDLSRYVASWRRTGSQEHLVEGVEAPLNTDVAAIADEDRSEPSFADPVGASLDGAFGGEATTERAAVPF